MKVCTKCNIEKELDQFHKNKAMKDKLTIHCKVCIGKNGKLHYQANKEKRIIKTTQWNKSNKQKLVSYNIKKSISIQPGVYMVRNQITGERYIGQSKMPYKRHTNHMSIHNTKAGLNTTNPALQEDLIKFGREAFLFGIIEHCAEENLLARENHYIRTLKPEYN